MAFNIKIPYVIASHALVKSGTSGINSKSKAAGFQIDSNDSYQLKFNANGTIRTLVDTASAQSLADKTLTTPLGVVVAQEALFTQVAGNKTHTAAFAIPAGATILDVIITNTVVWNSGTSATLKAGLVDDDCFFTGLDVKTIPAAGKSINFAWPGDAGGASIPEIDGGAGNQQLGATNGFLYNVAAATLNVIITDVNVAGTNGRTRVTVLYSLPPSVISPTVV